MIFIICHLKIIIKCEPIINIILTIIWLAKAHYSSSTPVWSSLMWTGNSPTCKLLTCIPREFHPPRFAVAWSHIVRIIRRGCHRLRRLQSCSLQLLSLLTSHKKSILAWLQAGLVLSHTALNQLMNWYSVFAFTILADKKDLVKTFFRTSVCISL